MVDQPGTEQPLSRSGSEPAWRGPDGYWCYDPGAGEWYWQSVARARR